MTQSESIIKPMGDSTPAFQTIGARFDTLRVGHKTPPHLGGFDSMRVRILAATAVAALTMANLCFAEAWATKLFSETKHDFGTVARGSDTSYKFAAKNIYKQDIELLSVRSSCGCTTPTIDKKVLKTGEVGYVTATFNTRTFTGVHGATLTVEVRWNDGGNWRHA